MNSFTGTTRLIRLALRRDRLVLAAWLLVLAGLLALFTAMFVHSLPAQADVLRETRLMAGNAGFRMLSLSSGASIGAYAMSRTWVTFALLAAVMSVLCVVRHTRQNEETGRAELLGAGVVGPAAGLTAGVVLALGANAALAPLLGLAMIVSGQPAAGSLAAGASVAAVGVAFTGVAALAAQLSRSARGATGLAIAVLAVAFLVSGVGNMLGGVDAGGTVAVSAWPSWLSPIGWGYEMRPFGGEHWWLLGLFAAFTGVLLLVAGRLAVRRDLGAGALPERAGRAEASAALRGPFGLAWRLQRPAFFGWLVALTGFGLILGSVSKSAQTMGGSAREMYERTLGTGQMLDAWLTMLMVMGGVAVAIYAVQVLLRMREEEARGRLEPVLSSAVGRTRWLLSFVLTTAIGGAALLLTFATAVALTAGPALGDASGLLLDLNAAALAELPAVLAIAGLVVTIFAVLPRRAVAVAWVLLGVAILFSPLFDLEVSQWLVDLSPFAHQKAPAQEIGVVAVVALLGVAGALITVGVAWFRRRDLAPG